MPDRRMPQSQAKDTTTGAYPAAQRAHWSYARPTGACRNRRQKTRQPVPTQRRNKRIGGTLAQPTRAATAGKRRGNRCPPSGATSASGVRSPNRRTPQPQAKGAATGARPTAQRAHRVHSCPSPSKEATGTGSATQWGRRHHAGTEGARHSRKQRPRRSTAKAAA